VELRDYVRVLRKGWALILAVTIVGIGLGVGLTLLTKKVYQANVEVFASSSSAAAAAAQGSSSLNQGNSFLSARVQSYTDFATSPKVLGPLLSESAVKAALTQANRSLTQQDLQGKITADAPADRVLINLHVTDTNPALAATLANNLANVFNKVVPQTEQGIPVLDPTTGNPTGKTLPAVQLDTIHPATVPSSPITPNKVLNIGLGLVLGLLIGIGVAVVREVLDNTVKSARDFEEIGIPLLAQVAYDKRAGRAPIAFRGDAHSARSEAYRQLRTNLQFVDVDNPPRIIAVTSAVPGEGKSTTAINLAAALAEAGARVCLIEADLRRPSVAKTLGLVSDVGFTTVVIGKAPVETVLQNAGKNFAVLTCGPIPPNPSELLISQHARQVIFDIAEKVDFVILDTPPLLPVADSAEIATIADATILVHRAAKTTRDQATRSIQVLEKVGRRPVGVVLNMVTRSGGGRYDYEYGYNYYYSTYRPSAKTAKADASGASTATAIEDKTAPAQAALEEPDVASTTEEAPADQPKGRRARHRGAKRAAAAAAASSAAATSATATDSAAASFTSVNDNGAGRPAGDAAVTDAGDAGANVDANVDPEVGAEAGAEPAARTQTMPVAKPTGATAASAADRPAEADAFADEYDEYGAYDDEDLYTPEPAFGAARGIADDDTAEFGAVHMSGQEQLPLSPRTNGRSDDFDAHSFDEALGVKGDDRR
jgi:capsular exopolysaccharide synthesis family protein